MPKTGEKNPTAGIYKSNCCGVERTMPAGHTFPPCTGAGKSCSGGKASWTLVRKTQTK
jgi:hypothetical protein